MIVGTIANPSSPSVKFTELLAPTITTIPTNGNAKPNGINTSLNTGSVSPVPNGPRIRNEIAIAHANPMINCAIILPRADTPLVFRRDSLRKSSTNPIAPYPSVSSSTAHTNPFVRSAQSSVEIVNERRIKHAAHRRRALLLDQMPRRSVLADRLPAPLHRP